ncbi:MAG: potassium transporter TrkH [Desulfovibrio sp.]|nr:MAG: potassium transporter TrkH [Desulfovibrio sp.]
MAKRKFITPFSLPVYCFALAIGVGGVLLHLDLSCADRPISWLDAFFTATSAVCVTGLSVQDTGTFFTPFGQSVILGLIQLGGLGVMTYTSLALYLWRQRVSLTDRMAVGQSLLHDPSFHLGRFLLFMAGFTLLVELVGACVLMALDSQGFGLGSALFHSISAFCNAGFSLNANSLMAWRADTAVNLVFMVLIILGGLGFSVLGETSAALSGRLAGKQRFRLSFHARVVLTTTLFLIVVGWTAIFLGELLSDRAGGSLYEHGLSALFQSVTCRTAGFNTVDIGAMTNMSLVFMLLLMVVGGSPGSCAGGVKTTTLRAVWAFITAQVKGREQVVIGNRALDKESLNRAITLAIFAAFVILTAILALSVTEGHGVPHMEERGRFLDIVFEVVSAFGTVGLTTGLTNELTAPGKAIVMALMFVGRLGPIMVVTFIRGWQQRLRYDWPEDSLMIG